MNSAASFFTLEVSAMEKNMPGFIQSPLLSEPAISGGVTILILSFTALTLEA